jgi:hypothetical protein
MIYFNLFTTHIYRAKPLAVRVPRQPLEYSLHLIKFNSIQFILFTYII